MSYLTVKDVNDFIKKQLLERSVRMEGWSPETIVYSLKLDENLRIRWGVSYREFKNKRQVEKTELVTSLYINDEPFKPDRSKFDRALKNDENYSSLACSKLIESMIGIY